MTAAALVKEKAETLSEEASRNVEQLAKKITEYILDHQEDAAQEERWRTTMKRDMVKSFREHNARRTRRGFTRSARRSTRCTGSSRTSRTVLEREPGLCIGKPRTAG